MALLNWDSSYSVGVEEMDQQHIKLVELINQLYDAMKAGKSKDVLGKVFEDLISYTNYHFIAEEEMMKKKGFPEFENHLIMHNQLTDQVKNYYQKFKEGASFISIDVMNFLKDWLLNHINHEDKKYGKFINH